VGKKIFSAYWKCPLFEKAFGVWHFRRGKEICPPFRVPVNGDYTVSYFFFALNFALCQSTSQTTFCTSERSSQSEILSWEAVLSVIFVLC